MNLEKNKMITHFLSLTKNEKIEKISYIISSIPINNDLSNRLNRILNTNKNIDSKFIIGLYTDVIDFYQAVKNNNKLKSDLVIQDIQNKIKEVQELEKRERIEELSNIDKLLNDNLS